MAEEIRAIAEEDPEVIQMQIDATRSSITTKLEALEEQVVGTVQSAKDSVQETIDNVKETVQETVSTVKETVQETVSTVKETFDLPLQVERHPWPMMGGSFALGLLSGALLGKSQKRRQMPMERLASRGQPTTEPQRETSPTGNGTAPEPREPSVFDRFHEEIDQVKGLAIGLALGMVRDKIKEQVPQLSEQLGEVMDRLTTKLGGAVRK